MSCLCLEPLEERSVPSLFTWTGASNSDLASADNYKVGGVVPNADPGPGDTLWLGTPQPGGNRPVPSPGLTGGGINIRPGGSLCLSAGILVVDASASHYQSKFDGVVTSTSGTSTIDLRGWGVLVGAS